MRRPAPPLGYLLAIAGASMFAWLGPLSRWAEADGLGQLPFVAWRAGVGALVLVLLIAVRAMRGDRGLPTPPRELGILAIATLIGLVLNLAIFGAFARVPIAIALLALYTYPAMVAAVAVATGAESLSPATFVALVLALAGMATVVAGGLDPASGVVIDPVGVGLALLAAVSQTVFVTISRRGYPSIPVDRAMAVILGGSFAGCVLIGLFTGELGQLAMPLGRPDLLAILLVAGSLGAGIPALFFLGAIRLIGGMRTGILMLVEPVVAVALAAILLHEGIRPIQVLGAVGVLGAALVLRRASVDEDERRQSVDDDIVSVGVPGGP